MQRQDFVGAPLRGGFGAPVPAALSAWSSPPLDPSGLQGVADSEEDATTQKQRRLADPTRALDSAEMLPLDALEDRDVELLGDIAKRRDLIGAGPPSSQLAGGAEPEGLLSGEEAHALDESALDLAVVDSRVDGAADVHEQVRAAAGPVAREGVDLDLGGGDALGEVVKQLAGVGPPDVAEVRGAVEAVGGEVDAVEVGGVGEGGERGGGAEGASVGREAGVELGAGVGDGVAVEVGGGGGGGGGGVGDGVGGRFGDVDGGQRHVEGVGGDHGHFGVQALPHFRAAVRDEDGAVVIDVHEGAGLVEPEGGEGDAEFGGDQGQPALLPFVGGVELGDGFASGTVFCVGHDLLVHEWDVPVFELLVEVGNGVRLVQIDFSEGFDRHAKLVCDFLHE